MGLISSVKNLDSNSSLHVPTDEELVKIKRYLTCLLDEINELCKKNNIKWFLTGGSMLGAVRHGGFIPWDDDVDINMFRPDFEKFANLFKKNERLSTDYELLSPGDKGYYSSYPRIFCKNTYAIDIKHGGRGTGIWIDIFVIENAPDNVFRRFIHGTVSSFFLFIISCYAVHKEKEDMLKFGNKSLKRKVMLRDFFSVLFRFRPIEFWIKKADKYFSSEKNDCSSDIVVPTGSLHYWGEIYIRNKFVDLIEVEFDDRTYPIPKDYDYYLKKRYGDNYMVPPDEALREKHYYIKLIL